MSTFAPKARTRTAAFPPAPMPAPAAVRPLVSSLRMRAARLLHDLERAREGACLR